MSSETASKKYKNRGRRPQVEIGPQGLNPDRKRAARLAARVKDYAAMINGNGPASKAAPGAFHQPGSRNK
jgi:hypothetical protein